MTFGEFVKARRRELDISLRDFCEKNGYHRGNISKLENGVLRPPQTERKLKKLAKALHLKEGTASYNEFSDLAVAGNRTFALKNITNEEILNKLTAFLRQLDREDLTTGKLDKLIRVLSRSA